MKKAHILFMLFLAFAISGCTTDKNPEVQRETYANEEDLITLQHPKTRVIIRCYANEYQPAEICAKTYEKSGYIRVKDIPAKPAKYDFLKGEHYPTRRWREGETTPRW